MTHVQRTVIQLMVTYLLEFPNNKGITIKMLLELAMEAMVAQSQKQLKELLAESRDHKVVDERIEDGITYLYFNPPLQLIQKIL